MTSPADLDRRLSRKIESGKAIQLTPADLDLLISSGAIDTFRHFVSQFQRSQCLARNAQKQSIAEENSPSFRAQTGTSKLSGTTPIESVSEAQARVHAILSKVA